MSEQYAKDQPAGFTNRIQRIAIVGASGQVGRPITDALLKTGKHTITALTRIDSQNTLPSGIRVAKINYDDESTIVDALRGQQFLIISMSVTAPPDNQVKLINAAAKACVPYVMPNSWGGDVANEKFMQENFTADGVLGGIRAVQDAGVSAYIAVCCSFWYEYSLALPFAYGIDAANKKATLFGDGDVPINTSTWQQCGRAVAALLSLKELPEDTNDTSPAVSQWRNKPLYIASFLLSQRDMLDSVQRVQGTADADWEITHEPIVERYTRGVELMKSGDRSGFGIALYTRMFFPSRDGDIENKYGLANEALGLPKEDLDKATARSLHMSSSDWNPFVTRANAKIYD